MRSSPVAAAAILTHLILGTGSWGCGDLCDDEAPSFQLDVSLGDRSVSVRSLEVTLSFAGARYQRMYELSNELSDGETALSVNLGSAIASTTEVSVNVRAHDAPGAAGAVVAQGTGTYSVTPDGC